VPANRWLNKKYKDLDDSNKRTDLGTTVNVRVDLGGSPPKPPVKWVVSRTSLDGKHIKDPVLVETVKPIKSWGRTLDRHTLKMVIPDVTGTTYGISVKVGDKTVKTFDPFTTWKRVYLDVVADNATVLADFRAALPTVQAWFNRCNYLVFENTVKLGEVPQKSKDLSEGEIRGTRILCNLHKQTWSDVGQSLTLKTGTNRQIEPLKKQRLVGSLLELNLPPDSCRWSKVWVEPGDPARPLPADEETKIGASRANAPINRLIAKKADGSRILELAPNHFDIVKLANATVRVSSHQLTLDLNAPGLQPIWTEINAGRVVELIITPSYEQFGRDQGGVVANKAEINYRFVAKADQDFFNMPMTIPMNAALIAHEIGHYFGLAKKKNVTLYAADQAVFELTSGTPQVARALARVEADNPLWHGGVNGGAGEHCKTGCQLVDNIYKPNPPAKTCVMHWTAAQPHVSEDGFCVGCIESLRQGK